MGCEANGKSNLANMLTVQETHQSHHIAAFGLLAFKETLQNLPLSWNNSSDPCGSSNCVSSNCTWEGISCFNWRVTEITLNTSSHCHLSAHNVTVCPVIMGSLPEIMGLNFVTVFRLENQFLTGGIPESWGSLTALQTLNLKGNGLSGELPTSFTNLKHVGLVDLSNNNFDGPIPDAWIQMESLKLLDVADNCGVCGSIPQLPAEAHVVYTGSSIPFSCASATCGGSFSLGLWAQAAVLLTVVLLVLSACCWRRIYIFSSYAADPDQAAGRALWRNVFSLRRAPMGGWRQQGENLADSNIQYTEKVSKPPIVIVMPGGDDICTATPDEGFEKSGPRAGSDGNEDKADIERRPETEFDATRLKFIPKMYYFNVTGDK